MIVRLRASRPAGSPLSGHTRGFQHASVRFKKPEFA